MKQHARAIAINGLVVSAAVLLSACAMSDEKMARWLVAPGKFVLYTCPEMAERAVVLAARERDLAALMLKAGPDADGRLVSSMAYRPEYVSVQGEMAELRKAAAEKNCQLPSQPAAVAIPAR